MLKFIGELVIFCENSLMSSIFVQSRQFVGGLNPGLSEPGDRGPPVLTDQLTLLQSGGPRKGADYARNNNTQARLWLSKCSGDIKGCFFQRG